MTAVDARDPGRSDPHGGARRPVESRDPRTGEVWRRFDATDADGVAALVDAARRAQPDWSALPLRDRLRILDAFHAALYRRRLDVARTISRENGKAVPEALAAEVAVVLDLARFVIRETASVLDAPWFTPASLALWRKRVRIEHEPYGVVAVIAPWNYPFMLPAGIVLAALATGNTAVLKPSEFTPSSADLMADLFRDAGIPDGVFAVAQGDGATGALLTGADVDKVFFTGSAATGKRVAHACAERLVPCVLELGGSDPAIVLDDADVAHAASGILWGRFANGGQTCVAPKRVFVARTAYPAFLAALRERLVRLRPQTDGAEGYDVGRMIRPSQEQILVEQLKDAVARGARVDAGSLGGDGAGLVGPTVLTDVPEDSLVMRDETFGPLLPVVAVRDEDEAIARANDTPFGLSASVWSRNRANALRVARRLHAGTVMINDSAAVAGISDVPHGGVKQSGSGRSHGVAGLEECLRTKAVVDDRFASWRQPWWFGYGSSTLSNLDAFVRLAHGASLVDRARGLIGTLRLLFRPERPI